MSILCDTDILERLWLPDSDPLRLRIEPHATSCPAGVISYGLSSGGYDLRLTRHFKVFVGWREAVVDPKSLSPECYDDVETDVLVIPPHGFALGCSMEWLRIPRDVIGECVSKSTYARGAQITNVTPIEPEFEGEITIEISNTSPLPAKIYAGEGIVQLLFHLLTRPCEKSYADKQGRYQGQRGITLPFVR